VVYTNRDCCEYWYYCGCHIIVIHPRTFKTLNVSFEMMVRFNQILLLLLYTAFFSAEIAFAASPDIINIGVLSHRGDNKTTAYWAQTADYLTQEVVGKKFRIIPLDFDEIEPTIKSKNIHFILVNSGIYVVMEVRHRISRIATLSRSIEDRHVNYFGGVIFTLSKRTGIQTLEDLKNKSFMAVDETSLGGFQMALRELEAAGIKPREDFSEITFGGIHDNVVMSVLNGKADVGTIRICKTLKLLMNRSVMVLQKNTVLDFTQNGHLVNCNILQINWLKKSLSR